MNTGNADRRTPSALLEELRRELDDDEVSLMVRKRIDELKALGYDQLLRKRLMKPAVREEPKKLKLLLL